MSNARKKPLLAGQDPSTAPCPTRLSDISGSGADLGQIMTDFLNEGPMEQAFREPGRMQPRGEVFWILTP